VLTDAQKETLSKLKGAEFSEFDGPRAAPPVAAAKAQQTGRVPPFHIRWPSVELVHFAALEAVQMDLAVSEDVGRKLMLLRDDYRAAYQKECQAADISQPFGPINTAFRKLGPIGKKLDGEYIPKVNELLSADQQKRLAQIRLQGRLATQGVGALLDVASELKLTDDQRQKLDVLTVQLREANVVQRLENVRNGPIDREAAARLFKIKDEFWSKAVEVLSAEQKATLETLKGRAFDTSQLVIRGRTRDT
jgi:hypothetical protein